MSTGVGWFLQDGTKVTFPLRWLITNSPGTPCPCNDSSMLQRVRNCRSYYYYYYYYYNYNQHIAIRNTTDKLLICWMCSYSLTLIDALDTLAIIGNYSEFRRVHNLLISSLDFDRDINVSVFETNIRGEFMKYTFWVRKHCLSVSLSLCLSLCLHSAVTLFGICIRLRL